MLVSNTQFLQKLQELFQSSTDKHSIYLTSKRAPPKALPSGGGGGAAAAAGGAGDAPQLALLFKATNGATGSSRIKLRTLVLPADLASFQTTYLPVLRASLSASLKKRDKAKERKAEKLKEAARKRLVVADPKTGNERLVTNHIGAKRGAGRRKRQRALKKGIEIRKEMRKEARRKKKAASRDGDVVMADA
ncbi:hypothetical protein ACQY0O_008255 [Thecaphora frezii]